MMTSGENNYRALTAEEIALLEQQQCSCAEWGRVSVTGEFRPECYRGVEFQGDVRLGAAGKAVAVSGADRRCGIYSATLCHCSVGADVYIANVRGALCNLEILPGTVIEDVYTISCPADCTFGCGVKVGVLSETGGREVGINPGLTAPAAYLHTFWRHDGVLCRILDDAAEAYAANVRSSRATIGPDVRISGCGTITGVNITDGAIVEGVSRLSDGTVRGAYIGADVIADGFVVCRGSRIDSGAQLHDVFVGHECSLGYGFSAHDSLIFSCSKLEKGEADAIFAGPFTTSMHKSTLLIGGYFSFFNAGSATNQSNHLYKLGPMHQGTLARGCRTGSGSYLMWPAAAAPFTTVTGHHYGHPDTREFPFSYLINDGEGGSLLLPGAAVGSVGLARDVEKWPSRLSGAAQNDPVDFRWLSPYTMQGVLAACRRLEAELIGAGSSVRDEKHEGYSIPARAIRRGLERYDILKRLYTGGVLRRKLMDIISVTPEITSAEIAARLRREPEGEGAGRWVDLAGMIASRERVDRFISALKGGESDSEVSCTRIAEGLDALREYYREDSWQWTWVHFEELAGVPASELSPAAIADILAAAADAAEKFGRLMRADAAKEFDPGRASLGFGIDAAEDTAECMADFARVRGSLEGQRFLALLDRSIATFATPSRALAAALRG